MLLTEFGTQESWSGFVFHLLVQVFCFFIGFVFNSPLVGLENLKLLPPQVLGHNSHPIKILSVASAKRYVVPKSPL